VAEEPQYSLIGNLVTDLRNDHTEICYRRNFIKISSPSIIKTAGNKFKSGMPHQFYCMGHIPLGESFN
jgi:hypothetical protein